MSTKKVVVVGSGVTGITAAAYFEARKGNSFTLIDSDERAGGLLKSDFSNGQYFDYGTHIFSSKYCENYFKNLLFVGRNSCQAFFMNDVLADTF